MQQTDTVRCGWRLSGKKPWEDPLSTINKRKQLLDKSCLRT